MKLLPIILSFTALSLLNKLPVSDVFNAFKRGNATQLSTFFDNNVILDMGDKQISYSKRQAELVIKDFFLINPVKNFEVLKVANKANLTEYCLGNLNTVNGLFHTTFYIKQMGNRQFIEEIHFEKQQ